MPLAWAMRPTELSGFAGQTHLLSKGRPLRNLIDNDRIVSVIFHGPPGSGKTALAHIIAEKTKARFIGLNAVTSGVKDIREAVYAAGAGKTIVFIDEIHRFNKVQQDALLPHIESGELTLIGASTANPFFALTPALLSRTTLFQFNPLSAVDLESLLLRAAHASEGLAGVVEFTGEAIAYIALRASGDARKALNIMELAFLSAKDRGQGIVDPDLVKETAQDNTLYYDEDEHYDTISAFIKSMRGSDPDAALYWLARMLAYGEDPLFIARRIMICASEDVGNADPMALTVAVSAAQALERVGMPEGRIPLSQATIYVATAHKSNASYLAIEAAIEAVRKEPVQRVPAHLRDASYSGAASLGVGGYLYPHDYPGHYVKQNYLLKEHVFYKPSTEGAEPEIQERLENRRKETYD